MQQPRIGLFFDFTAVQWQQPLSDLQQQGLVVSGRPYLISSVPPACSALQDSCSITLQPRLPPGFQLQLLTVLHSMFHFCCRLGTALEIAYEIMLSEMDVPSKVLYVEWDDIGNLWAVLC